MRRKERRERTDPSTLFSASVEDSHVLQIHTQTAPHGQGLAGVSLEATANGTVRVRPGTVNSRFRMCSLLSSSSLWHQTAYGPLLQLPSTGTKKILWLIKLTVLRSA